MIHRNLGPSEVRAPVESTLMVIINGAFSLSYSTLLRKRNILTKKILMTAYSAQKYMSFVKLYKFYKKWPFKPTVQI